MRFHPDHAGDGSVAEFLAIKAAYESIIAGPRLTTPNPHRRPPTGGTVVYRPAGQARARTAAAYSPERRDRATGWTGGRWYWEGLGANAAKRAHRERTA
jgi:hypothetical protein